MKNKWVLVSAAVVMLAVTWLDGEFAGFSSLSTGDLLPVLLIAGVIFLFKTGIFAALLLGLKKLWEKLRK